MKLQRIQFADLTVRQKQNYNYQKVSGILADFGFVTTLLSNDWNGADFLAIHRDGEILKVQLKPAFTFMKKNRGLNLWVCFPDHERWYLFPHDALLKKVETSVDFTKTASWNGQNGAFSFPSLTLKLRKELLPYEISNGNHLLHDLNAA